VVALAIGWAVVIVIAMSRYHINEPLGVRSVTTNGHTYYGDPPALTLRQRDPASCSVITVALGLGLLTALIDLIVRKLPRVGALIAGLALMVFSLLGLLLGLVTVGVDGALLVLAGLLLRRDDQRAGGPNSRSPASPSPGVM